MFLNKQYLLRNMAKNETINNKKEEVLYENKQIFTSKNKYDVFLSHSYLDKDLVIVLVSLFNKAQYSVYGDWVIDKQLNRSSVSRKTSEILRDRLDASRSLAYVATCNTTLSKWCPWELGYGDGKKKGRCAILPVLNDESSSFKGQEYLSLYPHIEYDKRASDLGYDFWICDNENREKYVILSNWLDGKNPTTH